MLYALSTLGSAYVDGPARTPTAATPLAKYLRSASAPPCRNFFRAAHACRKDTYHWRKKLLSPSAKSPAESASFQPVQVVSPLATWSRQPTMIRLANGIEIELGNDLVVVAAVIKQLLGVKGLVPAGGGESC